MPAFRWRVCDLTPLAVFVAAAIWPLADGSGQGPQQSGASPARAAGGGALAAQPKAIPATSPPAPAAPAQIPGFAVRPSPRRFEQYQAKPPRIAMLVTDVAPDGARGTINTRLLIQRADASAPERLATLEHPAGSIVRGSMIPHTNRAAVSVDLDARVGRTWSASLVLLEAVPPGSRALAPPAPSVDGLYLGAAPVVLDDGRIIVQRGEAGQLTERDIEEDRTRIDRLLVDAVLPDGSLKHLRDYRGYIAHVAGAIANVVVVYVVGQAGAELVCLDVDAAPSTDRHVPVPAYASDFTPNRERGTILFTNRAPERGRWTLNEVDSGCRHTELATSVVPQVPSVWRGGSIAFAREAGKLEVLDAPPGARPKSAPRSLAVAPSLPGSKLTTLTSMSPDQSWGLGLEYTESGPRAVAVYARGAESDVKGTVPIASPPSTRIEMLEVVP